jgi:ABC-type transporter lipoprotein component MlaA
MSNYLLESVYNDSELNELFDKFVFTPMMQDWKDIKNNVVEKY